MALFNWNILNVLINTRSDHVIYRKEFEKYHGIECKPETYNRTQYICLKVIDLDSIRSHFMSQFQLRTSSFISIAIRLYHSKGSINRSVNFVIK